MVDRICDNCMSRVPADAEKCPRCGIHFENTNPGGALPNGWVLGERYTIGRYLDIDGEGVAYSAIDGNTLQRVIVKEYMPVTLCATRDQYGAIVPKPGCEVLFKTTRMDFAELYGTLLRIGLVEGLVQVLDMLEANNTAYAVLEKVEGPTLTEYLMKQEYPMDPNRALALLRPVLLGVEALHAANVVHRGISPDNIVLESGGTAKLGGYATLALRQQGSELKSKLYPGYSAPEQYTAAEFEGRYTDIYALGGVLYRMVTDEAPLAADERKVQDYLQPARTLNKEVPGFLSTAIARCMRLAPAERIQNIGDLRLALSGEGGRVPAPAKARSAGRGLSKQQMIVGGIALGLVLLLLLAVLLISLLGKKGGVSSSVSASSASILVDERRVPSFVGHSYQSVINNTEYTDVYTFENPEEKYSDEFEEGVIMEQTPAAGTDWDGETPIKLVVSLGREPVDMPDFVTEPTSEAEAKKDLEALGITDVEVIQKNNTGKFRQGDVMETTPAAGSKVVPGKDKVTLYVAGAAATTTMPDVSGDPVDTAKAVLMNNGIPESDISISDARVANTQGRQVNGRVAKTDPAAGSVVTPGGTKVTISLYENYKMPDLGLLVGMSQADAEKYCKDRDIPYRVEAGPANGDNAGRVSNVDYTRNVEVTDATVVVIYVYTE